jgi:ribosomal protein S18 acetylase RimI-like enzyme
VNAPPIHVRRAVVADLLRVAELAARLVRQHHAFDPRRFFLQEPVERGYAWWLGRELDREGALVLVAERGERVLGYTYATIEERDWNLLLDAHAGLHDIYVDDDARGLGIGGELLAATLAECARLGAPRVVLMTATQNVHAHRLFARHGFRSTMVEMTCEL